MLDLNNANKCVFSRFYINQMLSILYMYLKSVFYIELHFGTKYDFYLSLYFI